MATPIPPVVQFQLPQPGQSAQPQPVVPGAPPVAQFQLPANIQAQSSSQTGQAPTIPNGGFGDANSNFASGNAENSQQQSIGALKNAAAQLSSVGGTGGGNPVVNAMLAGAPAFNQDVQAFNKAVQPSNPAQQAGATQTSMAVNAIPAGAAVDAVSGAVKAAKAPAIAKQIASAKPTLGTVAKGLMSMGENTSLARDAKAIEPLVINGVLKAGSDAKTVAKNVSGLKNAIAASANDLITKLKSMQVQPLVQPEELTNIFKQQLASIEKNVPPSGQAAAKTTAQWIWQKFINNLPKGKDITASDLLDARKATDAEVESIKGQNVFDPATENGFSTGLRAFRQGANNLLEVKAPGSKAALSFQSSLYNVLENVSQKGAGVVKKANEIAETPGIKGLVSRHPFIAGAASAGTAKALEGAGFGAYNKYFNQ